MIEIAKLAAKTAGKIIIENINRDLSFEQKIDKTFVSEVDRKSEEAIKNIIRENYPDHTINGEELGSSGKSEYVWHIDPLDGTNNFKNKIRYSCISIGLQKGKEFIIGVIFNPYTNELFYAEKDKGAFLNTNPISANKQDVSTGIILIDSSFKGDRVKRKLETQKRILDVAPNIRMFGSNALQLTEIAKGSGVCSISDAIHTYDFAAGIVLVREAGGIVTDQFGNEPQTNSTVIIASNSKINHDKIIEITKETYADYSGM